VFCLCFCSLSLSIFFHGIYSPVMLQGTEKPYWGEGRLVFGAQTRRTPGQHIDPDRHLSKLLRSHCRMPITRRYLYLTRVVEPWRSLGAAASLCLYLQLLDSESLQPTTTRIPLLPTSPQRGLRKVRVGLVPGGGGIGPGDLQSFGSHSPPGPTRPSTQPTEVPLFPASSFGPHSPGRF